MICLDTNVAVDVIRNRAPAVRRRLNEALVRGEPVGLPVIALYELWHGVAKSGHPRAESAKLEVFLALPLEILPFEPEDAEEAAAIRAEVERSGQPIGPYDVLIAAQARRRGAAIATRNGREFSRVPDLLIEDWSRD